MKFLILLITMLVLFMADVIYSAAGNYCNLNKKALINGKDTCIILYEDRDGIIVPNIHKRAHVVYKDMFGRYNTTELPEQMITILE